MLNLVLLLSCMAVCGPRYCSPARQAVRCICMYYKVRLVRLSLCLNHIKGTIIIIIIIMHELYSKVKVTLNSK